MKDNQAKKELIASYKEREVIGGVYAIKNTENHRMLLGAAVNIQSIQNRFEFSQKTGSCVDLKLQNDWNTFGSKAFAFEVLEELKKGETQTADAFKSDIEVLKEMWLDKLSDQDLY